MNNMKARQQGFTLIELMIVIAIVGILAAIALPAYQDYTVRAKMAEPLALLGEAKTSVTEFYVTNNSMPTEAQAGIRTTIGTDIVEKMNLTTVGGDPLLTVTMQSTVIPGTGGKTLLLSGTASSGTIQWVCKPGTDSGGTETKYLPANCRG